MRFAVLAALVFVPMILEAIRASANERAQLARGGIEPSGDVYDAMRVVYPALFAVMLIEGVIRGPATLVLLVGGATVFAAAKLVKWAAILALGPAWTFRVIVVPGSTRVTRGPYRYMRHPNYVGVIGELVGVGMMAGSLVTGPLAIVVFGVLLRKRLAVEERALAQLARGS